ncbi:MAG TPA: DUF4142 domain-containing protein [Burkholderiaceae bacterium]|nr:DUF4142 domain-containing protein [Burkholderiaceae bacterium]
MTRLIHLLFVLALFSTLLPDAQAESLIMRVAPQDKSFVHKAAIGSLAEVEMGRIAQQQAASDDVKTFAGRMIDEHTRTGEQLAQLATTAGAPMPTELDRGARDDVQKLSRLSGEQFDKAYLKRMVSEHKKTIAMFEKQARSGKDPNLKAFAEQTLPILRSHREMALQIVEADGE